MEMLHKRKVKEMRTVVPHNMEIAMQWDAQILAICILAADILCDTLPRAEITGDRDAAILTTQLRIIDLLLGRVLPVYFLQSLQGHRPLERS